VRRTAGSDGNVTNDSAALFGAQLRRLLDQLDGALEAAYAADGLDFRPRFTPVVRLLEEGGPQPIRDLSNALGLSHSAISQTVAEMRARGLVALSPGRDARQRIVATTPALTALLPRLRRHWAAATAATRALDAEAGGLVAAVVAANRALADRPFAARLAAAAAPDPIAMR
jgi:MarR family transcriptional regulator, organic hydroperoxide resistance regulator